MRLELIRSTRDLDVSDKSLSYQPTIKGRFTFRSHIADEDQDKFVYAEFESPRGGNLPAVRIALSFEDAIKIIEALADKGDPKAALTKNACALAFAIADFAKEATGQAT